MAIQEEELKDNLEINFRKNYLLAKAKLEKQRKHRLKPDAIDEKFVTI